MAEGLEGRALLSVGLDPTYGFGGVAPVIAPQNTSTNSYSQTYSSIAMQNGQVVEVGTLTNTPSGGGAPTTNLIVTRLTTNGFPDPTFGSGGTETIPLSAGGVSYTVQEATDIAVQTNGSIDVLGWALPSSGTGHGEFVVAQLTPNGAIDTTFGTGGFQLIPFGPSSSPFDASPSALAIGPDGKIVAVGDAITPTDGDVFAIARLNTNGSLDTSFNGTGTTTVVFNVGNASPSSNAEVARGVVVQPDGKIVVVGSAQLPSNGGGGTAPSAAAVARLNADGTLDTSFNGTGTLTYSYTNLGGSTADSARDVALQGSQIVIVGSSKTLSSPSISDATVTRLLSNGAFDTTFNGSGKYLLALNQGGIAFNTNANGIVVLPNNSLVIGGGASPQNGNSSAGGGFVLQLNPNGSPDTSFGSGGMALLPQSIDGRLLLQSDGKLVFLSSGQATRTTAPSPASAVTTIITTGTGRRARAVGVTIQFNTALNEAALTSNPQLYQVRPVNRRRLIRLKKRGGVTYNSTTHTLTLTFAQRTPVGSGFVIMAPASGIIGADGQIFSGPITVAPPVT